MKLLIGAFVLIGFLLMAFFGGMAGQSTGLLGLSCMGFSLVGNPLLWVAMYRVFTGAAGGRIVWVRDGVTRKPEPQTKARFKSIVEDL